MAAGRPPLLLLDLIHSLNHDLIHSLNLYQSLYLYLYLYLSKTVQDTSRYFKIPEFKMENLPVCWPLLFPVVHLSNAYRSGN